MLLIFIILLFTTSIFTADVSKFLQVSDKYYISIDQEPFLMAYTSCKLNGWEMATILNKGDNDALNDTLSALSASVAFWIGGIRLNNMIWVWLPSSEALNFTNWGTDEPYYQSGVATHCLQFNKDRTQYELGQWEARDCDSQLWYICQKY